LFLNWSIQAHLVSFLKECAVRDAGHFNAVVEQMSAEEMIVVRKAMTEQ
jgi:importin-9